MSKPSVMIDGFNLALERGTGVATYARNLSFRLRDLGHPIDVLYGTKTTAGANALMNQVAFFDPPLRKTTAATIIKRLATSPFGLRAAEVPITGEVILREFQSRLPAYDRILNVNDVFLFARWHHQVYRRFLSVDYDRPPAIAHWTYPLPVRAKGAANIYTLHDLVPLRLPYTTLDKKQNYFNQIRDICRTADHIVTVSETSKRDIVTLFGVEEKRVTNTYQSVGVPSDVASRSDDDIANDVEGIFGLGYRDYFLFYGAIEPKKNVGRILEAFLLSGVTSPMVLVGAGAWKSERELRLLKADRGGARAPKIVNLDYLPLSLLVTLIRGAKAVVFPSLYEGFGLPILEAMQLGTPVITGTAGSNPEVAGDAALKVDPYDSFAIAAAMRRIDQDRDLCAELSAAGRVQAKLFSEEAYSARLKALYASLA